MGKEVWDQIYLISLIQVKLFVNLEIAAADIELEKFSCATADIKTNCRP